MNFRIRISAETSQILKDLQNSTQLTPNILARLAISLSLIQKDLPKAEETGGNNVDGLELNRHTLTGQYDTIFRCLVAQRHGRYISDEEFFPTLLRQHLERGAQLLINEYEYTGSYERLIRSLVRMGEGVSI